MCNLINTHTHTHTHTPYNEKTVVVVVVPKYSEKVSSPKKQKKEETETKKDADRQTVVTKQNKTNITPDKDNTASAWRMYKFAPHVATQLWRANQHEPASFRLSSPWSYPSCSDIRLHAVVQPWLSLQRSISRRNVPPIVPASCAIPPRLGLQNH